MSNLKELTCEELKDYCITLLETIQELERKLNNQKHVITEQQESLRQKNLALDSLFYVWCDGGCEYGVARWCKPPTREQIEEIVRNTERLVQWHNNREFKTLSIKERFDYLRIIEKGAANEE